MDKTLLLQQLDASVNMATQSKWKRFGNAPFNYFQGVVVSKLAFRYFQQTIPTTAATFFGTKMNVLLPGGLDIYLTGAKSHPSELKLARFLVQQVQQGSVFLDIGAHYGFFSLLAEKLGAKVFAIEASPTIFDVLKKNCGAFAGIQLFNKIVADQEGDLKFYEFPGSYSEYNSISVLAYEKEKWFKENPPKVSVLQSITLDNWFLQEKTIPTIIKIDVEGAEENVLKGAKTLLQEHKPTVIMEFWGKDNATHTRAAAILYTLGYQSYLIQNNGTLQPIADIPTYLLANGIDSENVVFV